MIKITHPLNIIYVCTAEKGASGGAKIIYDHSEHINRLNIKNLSSEVLHVKKRKIQKWNRSIKKILNLNEDKYSGWSVKDICVSKNYRANWFKNNVKIKENLTFKKERDFIVLPEIFAHFGKKMFADKKIPYAIFALNGYTLRTTNDYKNLDESYKASKFILSISKDTTNCLKLAFPKCKNKILHSSITINSNKLTKTVKKNNTITYMPRKLNQHSELVLFFLRKHLPKSWKIKKIHNFSEKKVFSYMQRSKIFLSFTHFEGLGMPPIEAAIAGNRIIGYTGEAGKAIWNKPIFTEIPNGNVLKFVETILKNLKIKSYSKECSIQKKKLINKFSTDQERKHLIKMINKIKNIR